jgi:hypothetical protein
MAKLAKNTFPPSHSPTDFKCFGPPATKDGQFSGTMIADLGCFAQGDVDSNKYVHSAVVQSRLNNQFYHYTEHGRVGVGKPGYQFIECGSQAEAISEYEKYCHSKNDKRGFWVDGKLEPKPDKDCYFVRAQATRITGLPDAKTIVTEQVAASVIRVNKGQQKIDAISAKLIADLNIGTTSYTRGLMADAALPTLAAIEEGREICSAATQKINKLGTSNNNALFGDKELVKLTNLLFSRIPKKKNRGAAHESWFLIPDNISGWLADLDAFEAAIKAQSGTAIEIQEDLPFSLESLPKDHFIYSWMPAASRNVHGNLGGKIRIENLWAVKRPSYPAFEQSQAKIAKEAKKNGVVPLHQTDRLDLDSDLKKLYNDSRTFLLCHGTRSINVKGILNEGFRLPQTLTNVVITGKAIGQCVYLADDYKKSIGYTSYRGSYWAGGGGAISNRKAFMFICDAVLGNVYVTRKTYPYTSPPENNHSIAALEGVFANNEYGIFNPTQVNIRYLVEFSI